MIIPLKGLVGLALGAHNPRNESILRGVLVPPSPTALLLQGPDVDEHMGIGPIPQLVQQGTNCVLPALPRGEVMDDGNANDKVESPRGVGQVQAIGDGHLAVVDCVSELDQLVASVRAQDMQLGVYGQVLAISAADVEADGASGTREQESRHKGPGFVAGGGEVRRYGVVDCMDVG